MRLALPLLAVAGAGLVLLLGRAGDLREQPALLLAGQAALLAAMLAAWAVRKRAGRGEAAVLAGAALLRLAALASDGPMLSDDVWRYVWDGRVQAAGIHPYAHAPDDPALAPLRDGGWARINHKEIPTIYPPLAQLLFRGLAGAGLGERGFRAAMALLDLGVVLALRGLLHRLFLPADRLVLYAWNPLAVLETAGSGHLEPLGVALLLPAVTLIVARPAGAAAALAGAVHAKLLPLVLVPGFVRRLRGREVLLLATLLVTPVLLTARQGPAWGGGTEAYARRWERNASAFALVREGLERADPSPALDRIVGDLPALRALIWPDRLARLVVSLLALGWVGALAFRPGLSPAREAFLALGGVLVLSPVLHPWYLLWVLPFAAVFASGPWLLLAALVPLAYLGAGEVPASLRVLEYGPPLLWAAMDTSRRRKSATA